jgi:quercetin dioxygenase-like cupin family protein
VLVQLLERLAEQCADLSQRIAQANHRPDEANTPLRRAARTARIDATNVTEVPMPKVSKQDSQHDDYGPVESWHEEFDGQAVEIVRFKVDIDSTPMLKGLPGDRCTCPHWGYVLGGAVTFTVDGKDEVFKPGDAFYVPPGHLQRADAGTEYVQFSPASEMAVVEQQIMKNMQAMQPDQV